MKTLQALLSGMTRLAGPRLTARVIKALMKSMSDEQYRKVFGWPKELTRVPPGHFYSVFPDVDSVRARSGELFGPPSYGVQGIDLRMDAQFALARELAPLFADFPYECDPATGEVSGTVGGHPARYCSGDRNTTFHLDAVTLQAMLRHFRPSKVVEIGSGYSSAIMLDTRERHGWWDQQLTFIEPFSQDYFFPLLREEDREQIHVIEKPLWDVDPALFEELGPGDLLFIDSSHVAKIGSDVYHYLFNILPRLRSGVLVHIHDITTWFEMAPTWFDRGWYWNEGAFLRAFLMYNTEYEIVFHSSEMIREQAQAPGIDVLREHLGKTFVQAHSKWGNSFYMRRK